MAVNKVVYDGDTLIDLTGDTVTPETLAAGATAHDKAGNPIVGTMASGGVDEVYVGPDEPQDPNVEIWINPEAAPDDPSEIFTDAGWSDMDAYDGMYHIATVGSLCVVTLYFNSMSGSSNEDLSVGTVPRAQFPFFATALFATSDSGGMWMVKITIDENGDLRLKTTLTTGSQNFPVQTTIIYPYAE